MQPVLSIITVTLAYFAIAIVPGPNFLMTVKNALTYSRSTGLFTAVGVGVGTAVHGLAGMAGFFFIILQITWLYQVLKIVGGVYLIYVGIRALLSPVTGLEFQPAQVSSPPVSKARALQYGLFTSLSNPKTALFFLTIFTTLIAPDTATWAKWSMVLAMALTAALWYSLVALSFSQQGVQRLYQRLSNPIRVLIGSVFVLLGLRVATARS